MPVWWSYTDALEVTYGLLEIHCLHIENYCVQLVVGQLLWFTYGDLRSRLTKENVQSYISHA